MRKEAEKLADLIARETGKPLWEARTEVDSVVDKVEVSVRAYAERTSQRKLDSALNGTAAVRHKPHGVVAVISPYNLPALLPAAQIVPAFRRQWCRSCSADRNKARRWPCTMAWTACCSPDRPTPAFR